MKRKASYSWTFNCRPKPPFKECCSHLLLFEKIFKFFQSTFASMILLGTQDPNETFRGKCYYSIVEKLVGGCSAPLCVTVIGHRTWCCLSVAFLGWVSLCVCAQSLSCVQLFATPWTGAHQATQSMGICQARILGWIAMPPAFYFHVHFSCSSQDRC